MVHRAATGKLLDRIVIKGAINSGSNKERRIVGPDESVRELFGYVVVLLFILYYAHVHPVSLCCLWPYVWLMSKTVVYD